ncbi:hypothetical protein L7F22_007597 [Adiantum nelumboides]|nr:hypothetical protein [Adiantum nelumboides]
MSDYYDMGYCYIGVAKQLPRVQNLFEKSFENRKQISKYEMYKCSDGIYYGFRDEDNGALEPLGKEAEHKIRTKAIDKWNSIETIKNTTKKGVRISGEVAILKPVFMDGEE